MPAPQTFREYRPTFNHVNVMVDTFLANVEIDDLRSIIRSTLSSCPPSTATAFSAAATNRLMQTGVKVPTSQAALFKTLPDGFSLPAQELGGALRRSRTLYGAGMGFAGLGVLTMVVNATVGLRWQPDSAMTDALAAVDQDISQAFQSAKEELGGGRVSDIDVARKIVNDLGAAIKNSFEDAESWSGEFPFEQALASLQYWKF